MKRTMLVVLSFLLAPLVVAETAQATTYVAQAVAAVQRAPVFVASGTENTNSDTAGELTQQLNTGDNIVIVMLPAAALVETTGNLTAIAQQIDSATKHQKIIGLAVGDQIIGYSSVLPVGEAPTLMNLASSVSTNTVETLGTFIQDVHDWQTQNPKQAASQPIGKKPKKGSSVGWILVVLIAIILACLMAAVYIGMSHDDHSDDEPEEHIKFRSPDAVRDPLRQLNKLREGVKDGTLRQTLLQICQDTEAFFARHTSDDPQRDIQTFHSHLNSMVDILTRYIDVQNFPRFYDNPQELLAEGSDAINGFSEYVLNVVRHGSRRVLTDYNVDTKILSAQRYSS